MKKTLIFILAVAALFLILTAFQTASHTAAGVAVSGDEFAVPEDVSAIFDKSCFGCHNVESQAEKAQKKLLIDQLGDLSKAKLVGKLGEIGEVVQKNEMPPEKFLAKYPDKALTEEEAKRLVEWTESAANDLLK